LGRVPASPRDIDIIDFMLDRTTAALEERNWKRRWGLKHLTALRHGDPRTLARTRLLRVGPVRGHVRQRSICSNLFNTAKSRM